MKLFEIPIYALSEEVLFERVTEKRKKILKQCEEADIPEELVDSAVSLNIFPKCLWKYNHIIGYMTIDCVYPDICFNCYLPHTEIKRYRWDSEKKIYLHNTQLNGFHFSIFRIESGEDLKSKINEYLEELVNKMNNRNWFVDLETFNNISSVLDYDKLLLVLKAKSKE